MIRHRRKYGVAIIAVLGFLFSSPVAFAGMEISCSGMSSVYVNCDNHLPLSYTVADYYLPVDLYLYGNASLLAVTYNVTQFSYRFPGNINAFPDLPPPYEGRIYHIVALPHGIVPIDYPDAIHGEYDWIEFSTTHVYGHVNGSYQFYNTPPPIPFSAVALRVFTPTSSMEFLAGVGSSTTATGASLWPLIAIAVAIPLTFYVIHKIMGLLPVSTKTLVSPQKDGYTVKL